MFIWHFAHLIVPLTNVGGRLHLGKLQINLHFLSICTTFD